MQLDAPRRRSHVVPVFLTAALSTGGLTACSSGPDYQAVCKQDVTDRRVDDDHCAHHTSGYHWYYVGRGRRIPALGSGLTGGSTTRPRGSSVREGGFSAHGGTVERGGFGGRHGSVGG